LKPQARAIQDISRSRELKFTPLEFSCKKKRGPFCDFSVQNLSILWMEVEKGRSEAIAAQLLMQICHPPKANLAEFPPHPI